MIWTVLCIGFLKFVNVHGCGVALSLTGREVPMRNRWNVFYHAVIGIGTPPQELSVHFDTGSMDLFVYKEGYTMIPGGQLNPKFRPNTFNPGESRTFERPPEELRFDGQFASGSKLKGYAGIDFITIGSGENKIKIKTLISIADQVSESGQGEADGVFGLGFTMGSKLEKDKVISPLETIFSQTEVCGAVSFYAGRLNSDLTYDSPPILSDPLSGELYFGGFNKKYLQNPNRPDIITAKVTPRRDARGWANTYVYTYWEIETKGLFVGNAPLNRGSRGFSKIILDTGFSDIGISSREMTLLISELFKGDQKLSRDALRGYIDCKILPDELPSVTFKILDTQNRIRDLVLQPNDYIQSTKDETRCKWRFMEIGNNLNFYMLGVPFFQKYYTLFDFENKEVSFTLAKQDVTKSIQPGKAAKELVQKQLEAFKRRMEGGS
ncbi:cathepsin D-like [Macrosteles quadrilineatus]|uniref:cathepsin D-like n=1 Tax=Macrosteles quadrilineatus TaxID=74068 RepID=UPI0023E0AED8|nr:cathepsin D-like [Macrosteles quadrilineatus]